MPQLREQKERIEDIESARYITGALRDIAAIRLKTLREEFNKNDSFYSELIELYQLIWRIANESNTGLAEERAMKSLYVAYTTNRHFYGSINSNVIRELVGGTNAQDSCLILGDTGKQLWMSRAQKRKELSFMSFQDDMPTPKEIDKFLEKTQQYEHVYVFHPGFASVFRQDVKMVDITFRPAEEDTKKESEELEDLPQYLFEPDLWEMATFFNNQVRYTLFERMLLETQLSQISARLVKMDTADQNATELVKVEQQELRRAFTSFSSRRMLETLVGYIQWHNRKAQLIAQ